MPVVRPGFIPDFLKAVMEGAKDARALLTIKWRILFVERIEGRRIASAQGRRDLLIASWREGHGIVVVWEKSREDNLSDAPNKITFQYLTIEELVIGMRRSFGDQFNRSRCAGARRVLTAKRGGEMPW